VIAANAVLLNNTRVSVDKAISDFFIMINYCYTVILQFFILKTVAIRRYLKLFAYYFTNGIGKKITPDGVTCSEPLQSAFWLQFSGLRPLNYQARVLY